MEIDENNYLEDRTVCQSCCNKNRRKNSKNTTIQNQQPKIEKINNNNDNNPNVSTYENNAYVAIGPRNVGKTYYMLKIVEKIGSKRPIHIKVRSPNQYANYKTSDEIKRIYNWKGSVVIFDDMLGGRNSSQIVNFFKRGRHEDLDVYYISQSFFALPRQNIRNNSDRLILFKQTLRDGQSMYYDIGAYDMKYDELKEMCHKTWSEKFNYLCIIWLKTKMKVNIVFSMKAKPITLNAFPEANLYNQNNLCFRLKI